MVFTHLRGIDGARENGPRKRTSMETAEDESSILVRRANRPLEELPTRTLVERGYARCSSGATPKMGGSS